MKKPVYGELLQILIYNYYNTAASGYVEVTLSTGNTTLDLSDGSATANGKNLYIKVVGTLSGNASLTMPASTTGGNANRVFFVEDGTTRGGAGR